MDTQPEEAHRPPAFPSSQNSLHQDIQTEEIFDCSSPDCHYKSNWKESVGLHEKDPNCIVNSELSCGICYQRYRCLVGFFHHMSSQHPNKLFCPSCPFLAQDLAQFNAHMLAHSLTRSVSTGPSDCNPENFANFQAQTPKSTCQKRTEKSENFNFTLDAETEGEKILKRACTKNQVLCGNCSMTFNNTSNLRRHKKKSCSKGTAEFVREQGINLQGPPYSCNVCSFSSKRKSGFISHLKGHSNPKLFHCPIVGCKFQSIWRQSLRNHTRFVHHIAVPPKRPIQNKENSGPTMEFETEVQLDGNSSSNSMVFACMLCNFVGYSELSAVEHARQHTAVHIPLDRVH